MRTAGARCRWCVHAGVQVQHMLEQLKVTCHAPEFHICIHVTPSSCTCACRSEFKKKHKALLLALRGKLRRDDTENELPDFLDGETLEFPTQDREDAEPEPENGKVDKVLAATLETLWSPHSAGHECVGVSHREFSISFILYLQRQLHCNSCGGRGQDWKQLDSLPQLTESAGLSRCISFLCSRLFSQ